MQVLNAQLQAVVLAAQVRREDRTTPPPRCSRGGSSGRRRPRCPRSTPATGRTTRCRAALSNLHYQDYVVRLLRKLSSADPRFADAATRFAAYRRQPPAIQARGGTPRRASLLAVEAGDGRPSRPPGGRSASGSAAAGARWPGRSRARGGIYPIALSAVDVGGEPRVVPGTAARPRRARSTHAGGPRDELDGRGAARASRRGRSRRPARGRPRAEARAEADAHPCRLADRRLEAGACSRGGVPAARRRFHARGAAGAAPAGNSPGKAGACEVRRGASRSSFPASANSTLAPAARPKTAAAYAAALTAVRKAVQAELPGVAVGPLVDAQESAEGH